MNAVYHDILAVLPLPTQPEPLVERAEILAQSYGARLHLLLVLEPVAVTGTEFSPFDIDWSVEEARFQAAEETMNQLRERLRLPPSHASLRWGPLGLALQEHLQGGAIDLVLLPHDAPGGLGNPQDRVALSLPCDCLLVRSTL